MRFDGFLSMLEYWAGRAPEAPALRFARGDAIETVSRAALAGRVRARAEALRASDAACIGILCDGSAENVVEIFAAAQAGLQAVMLDAGASDALLAQQIAAADADRLWGDPELVEALSPALRRQPIARTGDILFFTSGTTHAAQAVALTQASLCASAWNGGALLPLSEADTLLCLLPLNHVFGFVCGLLWGLSCGACVALGRGMRHYADDCAFFRPTALPAVTMLLAFLVRVGALNGELRLVLIGAGACPRPLIDQVKATGVRVSFGYGLTETSSGVALSLGDDPYAMTVCPEDAVTLAEDGEILVSAPTCVMRGYYKAPEATAAALQGGLLHTGDLGRLDDQGRLFVTGRKKEILVLRDGTKIFLPEYEARLAAALPGRDFAVIDRDGEPMLAIRGEPAERAEITAAIEPATRDLPRGQRPAGILFLDGPLPRTATGKIKRWEIQQKAMEA